MLMYSGTNEAGLVQFSEKCLLNKLKTKRAFWVPPLERRYLDLGRRISGVATSLYFSTK
jgi:hypothetical protein